MENKITHIHFENTFNVTSVISFFYTELPNYFSQPGEQHDFWEMLYIDTGELLCTTDSRRFIIKSGEIAFHKPHELHRHMGNQTAPTNVSILCFECNSSAMQFFEGKILRLNADEKNLLSLLLNEGLSLFRLEDENNPLHMKMQMFDSSPFGCSQMTKNLLEIFLIKLCRTTEVISRKQREIFLLNGIDIPYEVKEILDFLQENIYGKITLKDISSYTNKSETSIKRLFSSYLHCGIIEYYNSLKMKEAKKLLREGIYNISQIADLLHFDTPQYFSKCFKQYTKLTPKEYKASIHKQR